MKARELFDALAKKFGTTSKRELAKRLGIAGQTLHAWQRSERELSPLQVANALTKSNGVAVRTSQIQTIRPIVELFPITPRKLQKSHEVIDVEAKASGYMQGLKQSLLGAKGIYIFYDSRGDALYAGQAKKQSIWKEMNIAFNRDRGNVQSVMLVKHPVKNKEFSPAHEKSRQPRPTELLLHELAHFFSAYEVDTAMIDDVESLLVRAFPNNLSNIKMERFTADRQVRQKKRAVRLKKAAAV